LIPDSIKADRSTSESKVSVESVDKEINTLFLFIELWVEEVKHQQGDSHEPGEV
jgi:hypothetical protein